MADKKQKKAMKDLGLKRHKINIGKWVLYGFLGVLVVVGVFVVRYLIKYTTYNDYKQYVNSYDYEEGSALKTLQDANPSVPDMSLIAENDKLKFYANVETGNIAVYDKNTGAITYSNPVDADKDTLANEQNMNYLKSQLIVDYFNTSRMESSFDSYSYCVNRQQLEYEGIENGIRFLYTIGDKSGETGIVPEYISQATLDEITSKMSDTNANFVRKKYKESSVADDYLELLPAAKNGASTQRKMNQYFEEVGFTADDYEREMVNSGVEGAVPVSFLIPLEYRLNDDNIEVSIPMKEVEENGGGAIYRIQLLNFFDAAGAEDEGYMFVPNGSGAIINFNNGKAKATSGNDYSEYVYGIDLLSAEYTVRENTNKIKMAMFGIFKKDSNVFATIEDGASLANITANVSGDVNMYNNVYATFIVRGNDKLSMFGTTGSENDLPIVEKNFYNADIKVRYTFLPEENKGYNGAANYYRDRLIAEGKLTPNQASGDIKFYYDVLGGVEETKFFLGTQYRGVNDMTTFSDAQTMAKDLSDQGISNQVMNFQGWTKGGYYHDVTYKLKVLSKLGGKSGVESLNQAVKNLGGTFYGDIAFQKVTSVSSHYSFTAETSRYYGTGYVAEFGLVNPATLRQTSGLGYRENIYYLVSPKFLVRYTGKFAKQVKGYDVDGISLRDLGDQLHSDKKRTNVINREDAKDVVESQLKLMADTGKNVMVSGGNDYSFPYVNDIINAPLKCNDYYVIDYGIPFYEMLIHGCIDYSGSVINLGDTTDPNAIALELIEAGASPHFKFTWKNANEMKHTGINRMFSTTYNTWKDTAVEIYNETNEALSGVNGAFITNYEVLDSGVTVTTYSNGVKIYVNRLTTEQTVDGKVIGAKSYEIGG